MGLGLGFGVGFGCATNRCLSSTAACDTIPSVDSVGICFSSTSRAISCGVLTWWE